MEEEDPKKDAAAAGEGGKAYDSIELGFQEVRRQCRCRCRRCGTCRGSSRSSAARQFTRLAVVLVL